MHVVADAANGAEVAALMGKGLDNSAQLVVLAHQTGLVSVDGGWVVCQRMTVKAFWGPVPKR